MVTESRHCFKHFIEMNSFNYFSIMGLVGLSPFTDEGTESHTAGRIRPSHRRWQSWVQTQTIRQTQHPVSYPRHNYQMRHLMYTCHKVSGFFSQAVSQFCLWYFKNTYADLYVLCSHFCQCFLIVSIFYCLYNALHVLKTYSILFLIILFVFNLGYI